MQRLSPTTWSGRVCAVALALSSMPGINHWVNTSMLIIAAISVAYLGQAARDCPPNCPGTDGHGKPIRPTTIQSTQLQ